MSQHKEKLIDCFSAVFPNLGPEEIPIASAMSVEEWDSLAAMNLIVVIQQEFAIEFGPEDYENMTSFDAILDLIESKSKAS